MGGTCDNNEGDLIEHICSIGFMDIREGVAFWRVTILEVRVY